MFNPTVLELDFNGQFVVFTSVEIDPKPLEFPYHND